MQLTANFFMLLFGTVVVLALLVQEWLASRHIRHILAKRDRVPDAFAGSISLTAHQKAADYSMAKTRLGRIELVYDTSLLLVWTLGGGLALLNAAWLQLGWDPLPTGVAVMMSFFLLGSLLDVPFSAWATFNLETHFGFNHSTPGLFVADLAKQAVLLLAIGTPLIALVLWLMQVTGTYWWLYVWAVWIGFSLLMMWAYPAFIAPLFNKFAPLDNAELRSRIENLLARCGFHSEGIFIMDGSRRSGHGNAYFTGLGRNKRIVFFDTLIHALEPDEIEAVLAHELGHFKRKHVQKRLTGMLLMSLGGLALLGWLAEQPAFYQGLGVPAPSTQEPSTHMALLLFMLAAPVFSLFLQPLFSRLSRKHEFEADDYAAEQTGARHLVSALVKLYRDNASTLTPDPLYSAFHDSHPPAPVRVAKLGTRG
ncbi:MAG: M48 family metallopeptidase [Gammaproteobacteria bacterium]|nr:M48 family metallopeptidase [Gammaproteobacteria bacterium]